MNSIYQHPLFWIHLTVQSPGVLMGRAASALKVGSVPRTDSAQVELGWGSYNGRQF
jgi:hypothetical protein